MQSLKRAMSIVTTFLISFAILAEGLRADGKDNGIGIALQKAPSKMLGLKNPYAGGTDEEGKAGLKLFKRHCASCHEKNSSTMSNAPSLSNSSIRTIPAGYLFWYLKNGNLRRGMPAWSSLPDERLWQLVTYLQDGDPNQSAATGGPR